MRPPQKTILIVDDEPMAAAAARAPLVRNGYQVETAVNGEQALEIMRTTPIDLVVLDVVMPGLSGFDVCRRLRQDARSRGVPVIFVTARGAVEDIAQGREAGSDLYLVKPVLPGRLLGLVEMLLSRDDRSR
jgi:DNA-binding response OmpR family regulator